MRCWRGSRGSYHHVDGRVLPIVRPYVAKGGSNTDANVQLLCRRCNLKKSDFIESWRQRQKPVRDGERAE
jgi:hypothetical protein